MEIIINGQPLIVPTWAWVVLGAVAWYMFAAFVVREMRDIPGPMERTFFWVLSPVFLPLFGFGNLAQLIGEHILTKKK